MTDRPLTRSERNGCYRHDHDKAVADVMAAYQENERPQPPTLFWCDHCGDGFDATTERLHHECRSG
jgi:hypothetical protein